MKKSSGEQPAQTTDISRRDFLKRAAYSPPAVMSLTVLPSFSAYASETGMGNKGKGNMGSMSMGM